MRSPSLVASLVLGLLLTACAGIEVSTNYDPKSVQQLEGYRSYAWLPEPQGKDPRVYNDITDANVRQAVDQRLAGRGYQKVAAGASPDFLIGWQGAIDSHMDSETVDSFYGYPADPFFGPVFAAAPQTYVREYEEGTLILDVVDAKAKKLAWRGTAQAEVNDNPSASGTKERIGEAVEQMLSRFPPKPGQ